MSYQITQNTTQLDKMGGILYLDSDTSGQLGLKLKQMDEFIGYANSTFGRMNVIMNIRAACRG